MTKVGAYHSEESYLDWFWNMDFTPEELTDIWSARSKLARSLSGTAQYPGTDAQMTRVDWYVHNVSRPAIMAGCSQHMGWNIQGYWEPRYSFKGLRGSWIWANAKVIIQARTGITPSAPFGPYY